MIAREILGYALLIVCSVFVLWLAFDSLFVWRSTEFKHDMQRLREQRRRRAIARRGSS